MNKIKLFSVLSLCFAVFALSLTAMAEKKEFKFPPLGPVEVPVPEKIILDNGMAIYLLEDHELPQFYISIDFSKCGDYLEPPNKLGLASMTGEVWRTGGTTNMTGDQIDEELEAIGAYVETGIGTLFGSAGAGGLSEYTEKIVSILADVIRNPVFDEDKVELARTNQKTGISRRNDNPGGIARREFRKLMYGANSPYARHTEYSTIESITRDDLVMFHKMIIQPNNTQMAVYGDINKDEMLALLKNYFGDWPASQMELPPPPEVVYDFHPSVNYIEKTDVTQSNVLVGHIGGKMGDPDYPATIVMNSILGGSFGSRITDNVRTKNGYAYSAYARYSFNYDHLGVFTASASTKLESTVAAIRIILEQIESMKTIPPNEDEMRKAKDGWLNSFVFRFDTKNEVLGRVMSYDYYGFPRDYLQQLKEAVEKVTPEDVVEVAKRKLNHENLQILVVGKGDEFDEPLSVFGEVNEIDITIPSPEADEFTATDEELAQGIEWISKLVEASGGIDNFKNIKTVSTAADITINMPQGAMTVSAINIDIVPDKTAQTINTPMGSQVEVFTGTEGWASAGGQTQAMTADQIEEKNKELSRSHLNIFIKSDNPDYQVAYKGEEEFEGKAAIRLDILTGIGAQISFFVDPAGYLMLGSKYMGETMSGPGEIIEIINEHGDFAGVKMPVNITQTGGGMSFDIVVKSTEINGEIDESIFVKPEGI